MTRSILAACLALGGLVCPAAAQDWTYISSEGHEYAWERTEDGAVLTSVRPVFRPVGEGATFRFEPVTEVIYLGRSCDAASAMLGEGTWAWANGGFVVELEARRLGFPRQEIDAGQGLAC